MTVGWLNPVSDIPGDTPNCGSTNRRCCRFGAMAVSAALLEECACTRWELDATCDSLDRACTNAKVRKGYFIGRILQLNGRVSMNVWAAVLGASGLCDMESNKNRKC